MNDDLISRKALIGTERLLMTDIVQNNPTAKYILEQVLFDIENAPAAFDKEKVIAKIDNASMSRCRYGFINFDLSPRRCIDCQNDFIRAVYEIVEKGGIE